jgi:tetratricopeptide (TPR) repeat protein
MLYNMDNNYDNTEKLVRYLDAELSEAERKDLQTELENNTAMQQELDNLIFTKSVIRNYGLAQKVNGLHRAMMEEMTIDQNATKAVVISMPKMMMRIAAGIILLVGLFGLYQYFSVSPGNLYNDQYTAYQVATMRGTTAESPLEKAYSEKKYDAVIALYTQTANPATNEQFLAAQAYLSKADYENAILLFNAIIEKNKAADTGMLNDEAEYYLALSYLKNKETAKALPLFKKIHDNKDHLYHEKISIWYLVKVKLLNWKN